MPEPSPIIRLAGVHKSFNGTPVLRDLSLDIMPGSNTVIIGPSGCGKSVLLKHIVGLLKPDRGQVFYDGHELSAMTERDMVPLRRKIGFLFQGAALFDSMTVEENIVFPLAEHGEGTPAERRRRCQDVLLMVGLDGMQRRYPEELSGGQKKRVALARAIALKPEVILYDEPTTGLDPIRADLINELINRLHKILGTTSVVVTHDMTSAAKVGHRIVMLHHGRVIADTTPATLGQVKDPTFTRFVQGRASEQELAELETGHLQPNAED
jgi:phospholipid/cholesterol/gamma-HCH transport system ATP-binding protein